jgi:hypothetical protein
LSGERLLNGRTVTSATWRNVADKLRDAGQQVANERHYMVEDYGLEPAHEALLREMVEARRNLRPEKRKHFRYIEMPGEYAGRGWLFHGGFPSKKIEVNSAVMDFLLNVPLTQVYDVSGTNFYFDISPEGLRYYADRMQEHAAPMERVEERMRETLLRPDFQKAHPKSYAKWVEAEALLWEADATKDESKIGLLCVEAVTIFTDELVERCQPPDVTTDRKRSKDRLSAVVKHRRPNLGNAESEWVDALFVYWSKVAALAQRVKHAAEKHGDSIVWNDGRRAVFQTLSLMYEVHDLLS